VELVGLGHAKLLLIGEHSAVYGFPALGLGLPSSTHVALVPGLEGAWSFPGMKAEEGRRLAEFLASAAALFPAMAEGGELRISSSIPQGLGFGSSAALCVALATCLAAEGASPQELWSLAHRAEHFFHGRPSGIDTGLSLLGGLRAFFPTPPGPPSLPLARALPTLQLHLVVGALPRRSSTAALVRALHARIGQGEGGLKPHIEALGELAGEAIALLEAAPLPHRLEALATLFGAAHRELGALGLGDPGIDRLIAEGVDRGALGGKQSGAGSGGAFFLLYPSASSARDAAPALAEFARDSGIGFASEPLALELP